VCRQLGVLAVHYSSSYYSTVYSNRRQVIAFSFFPMFVTLIKQTSSALWLLLESGTLFARYCWFLKLDPGCVMRATHTYMSPVYDYNRDYFNQ
jgi:hypothetical protein